MRDTVKILRGYTYMVYFFLNDFKLVSVVLRPPYGVAWKKKQCRQGDLVTKDGNQKKNLLKKYTSYKATNRCIGLLPQCATFSRNIYSH